MTVEFAPYECKAVEASGEHISMHLVWLVAMLASFGLVISTSAVAGKTISDHSFAVILLRRFTWFGLGICSFIFASRTDYHLWRRHNLPILAFGLLLLIAVLVPGVGKAVNGARRWIRIGPHIGLQPSELSKICLIIWVAAYCERNRDQMKSFSWGFLIPMLVVGLSSLLVLAEPDFGTAALLAAVGTIILIVSGTRLVFVLFGFIAMLPVVQKLIFDCPYRRDRVLIFMDPWKDPNGKGYQLIQSLIAIGSGGIGGRGLGAGQQKLGFLPEASTDFIFSVVSEELGLAGALVVIGVFILILIEGLRASAMARDLFGFLLGVGLTVLIGLQVLVNIGVVTGSLPPKGLSLPLISAGGSSLVLSMFCLGVLVNIARSVESQAASEWPPWELDIPEYERKFCGILNSLAEYLSGRLRRIAST